MILLQSFIEGTSYQIRPLNSQRVQLQNLQSSHLVQFSFLQQLRNQKQITSIFLQVQHIHCLWVKMYIPL